MILLVSNLRFAPQQRGKHKVASYLFLIASNYPLLALNNKRLPLAAEGDEGTGSPARPISCFQLGSFKCGESFIEKVIEQPGAKQSSPRPGLKYTTEEGSSTSSGKPRPLRSVEHSELASHGVIRFTRE